MRLNQDCVRELLLYLEENLSYGEDIDINDVKLLNYSTEEVVYAAERLLEADYLNGKKSDYIVVEIPYISVSSLTWNGHLFLDNIRDKGVWSSTKKILSKFSSVSLSIVGNIAAQVISNLISQQMSSKSNP